MYISLIIISLLVLCVLFCFLVVRMLKLEQQNKRLLLDFSSSNRQNAEVSRENDTMRRKIIQMQETQDAVKAQIEEEFKVKKREYKRKLEEVEIELERVKRRNSALEKQKITTTPNQNTSNMDKLKQGMYGVTDLKPADTADEKVNEYKQMAEDMSKRLEEQRLAFEKKIEDLTKEKGSLVSGGIQENKEVSTNTSDEENGKDKQSEDIADINVDIKLDTEDHKNE